jgi:hypothetical protein
MCTRIVISVHQLIHSSMQTDISSEVQQHTIKPVMLAKAFLTIPHRIRIPPLRKSFAIQIQHQHISGIQHINHSRTRICLPCLNDPNSFRIGFLHGFHYRSSGLRQVYPFCVASLMEWVHTIIFSFSVKFLQFFVVHSRKRIEMLVFRRKEGRTRETAPLAGVGNLIT